MLLGAVIIKGWGGVTDKALEDRIPQIHALKGYCTVFQYALKSLELTSIVLSLRISKTARKNSKGLISYKEFKF